MTLSERFGEPIGHRPNNTVGIADEGPGNKSIWTDEPKKDRPWSDPNVVKESACSQCGMMETEVGGGCPAGHMEGGANVKKDVQESRTHVSPVEVEQTWEDLYMDAGPPPLEVLASWLQASEDAVVNSLPSYLTVNKDGEVVEKGISEPPPPMSFAIRS